MHKQKLKPQSNLAGNKQIVRASCYDRNVSLVVLLISSFSVFCSFPSSSSSPIFLWIFMYFPIPYFINSSQPPFVELFLSFGLSVYFNHFVFVFPMFLSNELIILVVCLLPFFLYLIATATSYFHGFLLHPFSNSLIFHLTLPHDLNASKNLFLLVSIEFFTPDSLPVSWKSKLYSS